jgi:hypothetical protein
MTKIVFTKEKDIIGDILQQIKIFRIILEFQQKKYNNRVSKIK